MIGLVIVVTGLTGYGYHCKGSRDCDDSDDDDAECIIVMLTLVVMF